MRNWFRRVPESIQRLDLRPDPEPLPTTNEILFWADWGWED